MQPKQSLEKWKRQLEQSEESLPGVPLLELAGDKRILIEHHRGIAEYGTERIGVRVRYGLLLICGCGLEIMKLSKDQLVVCGRIDGIQILRGRC